MLVFDYLFYILQEYSPLFLNHFIIPHFIPAVNNYFEISWEIPSFLRYTNVVRIIYYQDRSLTSDHVH